MKWYQVDEDKKRQERLHRRKVIADWKAEAKAIQAADGNKKMLLREAKQVSLARIEDAARTEADFKNVMTIWNNREIVEKWRIAKHEEYYDADLPDTELSDRGIVVPKPIDHVYWRQLLNGSFLDAIHDCPHEIPNITTSRPVRDFTMELDDLHKELLYYWDIRQWTPQQIAVIREQTDRNIRKVYNTMIEDMRRKMYIRLWPRYEVNEPLTHTQREFMKTYWEQLDEVQQGRLTRKFEDEKRRRRKDEGRGKGE